jgi:hypothetical protein
VRHPQQAFTPRRICSPQRLSAVLDPYGGGSITSEVTEFLAWRPAKTIDDHNDVVGDKAVVQRRNIRLKLTIEPKVPDFGANIRCRCADSPRHLVA